MSTKLANRSIRKNRIKSSISPSSSRPRLIVNISNKQVMAQIVDSSGKAIASSNSASAKSAKTMTDKAVWVGDDIAKKAKDNKVKAVVLDRGYKLYHGRVKALADSARKSGLEF